MRVDGSERANSDIRAAIIHICTKTVALVTCVWWAYEGGLIRLVPMVWNQQVCGAEGLLARTTVSSNKSKNVPLGEAVA